MALTVYRSNRAEFLAQLLAAELLQERPDPFRELPVVVNTWPTSRWLGEQLAQHLGGVAAHLRFPFPGSLLRRLVAELLGLDPTAEDPWRAQRLVWPVLALLPEVAAGEHGGALTAWLAGRDPGARLDLAGWQLGRAIADAFDDYALYRPDLLQAWERGEPIDGRGRPLPAGQRWQPALYAALRQRLAAVPFGLEVEALITRLQGGWRPQDLAEQRLRLFGLSSLAPVQVRLMQALSGVLDVDLFLLTPCPDLWQRCADRRRSLSDAVALREPLDAGWLLRAPGLEARFGRLGAEFQQLLEGTGEAQLGAVHDRDLFLLPASAALEAGRSPSLLAQLQQRLAAADSDPLQLEPGDHSLEFHPCPGPLRQVQIVRDRLLQLMAADPSLQPRDILVMTPQIDRLAPLVASVFGDAGATGVEIPWRLTDRSQQSEAGIALALPALLRLAGERLSASGLEALLECRPLQQRFGLEAEQITRLHGVLQRCGFRWGLDGRDRGGDPTHSLAWVIDRLLLGLVLPEDPGLAPAATAPAALAADLELTGRWLHLLGRLRHWLCVLREEADVAGWVERLRALLADLFGEGGESAWELPPLLAALESWREAAASDALRLEAPVVAAVLEEALAADSGRFGHRSGALTISALEPMRAIPHRVVVLLGLDAAAFPRQRTRPGFHLMEQERRLGDAGPADQDRYALLEALLSARDHLLLVWSCRDERSGDALQPAVPVRQWQQWLEAELGESAAQLVGHHAADPLDPSCFRPNGDRPAPSCDRRLLHTLTLLRQAAPAPATGLFQAAMPAELPAAAGDGPFEDLQCWLAAPQRRWLEQLGLQPREQERRLDDLEALELEELQRSGLLRELRSRTAQDGLPPPGDADDWLLWQRGRGVLPAAAAATLEARLLHGRWSSLESSLAQLGPARQEPLAWRHWQAAPLWHGATVVRLASGRVSVTARMELWLDLLLAASAASAGGPVPQAGVLIARSAHDRFATVLRLLPPPPELACAELERLAELREAWRPACWPMPPRSGWAWLEAEQKRPGSGAARFSEQWEGNAMLAAERLQSEMVLCFGASLPAAELLAQDPAVRLAELYGSLRAAEVKP
jgi:exodeoxyribonuclease V gamma subunit